MPPPSLPRMPVHPSQVALNQIITNRPHSYLRARIFSLPQHQPASPDLGSGLHRNRNKMDDCRSIAWIAATNSTDNSKMLSLQKKKHCFKLLVCTMTVCWEKLTWTSSVDTNGCRTSPTFTIQSGKKCWPYSNAYRVRNIFARSSCGTDYGLKTQSVICYARQRDI